MSAPYEPEEFDFSVIKLALLIIVGIHALQLGFAGLHLFLSERYALAPASEISASPPRSAAPTPVQLCGSREFDISTCEDAIAGLVENLRAVNDYCPAPGDMRTAAAIVRRYLIEHPGESVEPLDVVVHTALVQAWPCR